MRAAIYSRFSTELQDAASIADQERVCGEFAARHGFAVVDRFSDHGVSGAAIGNRPGVRAMIAAAQAGAFDVLLVAELSRLSRSAGDLNKTIDLLVFRGVRVVGVSNGYDSARKGHKLQAGVEGIMGEAFRELIRDKTREALRGRVDRGLSAGGRPFGYRSRAVDGGSVLEVFEPEAEVVREIFAQYLAGVSPRRIAHALNERGVASPRSGTWAVSAICGSRSSSTGILRNPIYKGARVWRRSRFEKDPETGKRKRFNFPEKKWIQIPAPELAIVSLETWNAVAARIGGVGSKRGKPARTLLGGLLTCGHCGGPVVAIDRRVYGCAAARDRGPAVCPGVKVRRETIETAIVGILRGELLSDEAIEAMRREVAAIEAQTRREAAAARKAATDRREQLEREVRNLTDAVASAGWSAALRERLLKAETELAACGKAEPEEPAAFIPRLLDQYREKVENLPQTLLAEPEAARAAIAELLGSVLLEADDGALYAEIERLGRLPLNVVAGAGFGIKKRRYRVA